MTHAEIRLGNGDVYTVEGTLDEVERGLSDAARSGQARLAWFKERGTAESIGINPAHVAALRGGETSDRAGAGPVLRFRFRAKAEVGEKAGFGAIDAG